MAVVNVTVGDRNIVSHFEGRTDLGEPFCDSTTVVNPGYQSMVWVPDHYESKTIIVGDKVHSTTWSKEVHEIVALNGAVTTRATFSDLTDTAYNVVCGSTPKRVTQYTADVLYYVQHSDLSYTQWPQDTASFLRGYSETQALADLRRSLVNLPLVIAERRETLALIKSKSKQLATLVHRTQSKDLKRWKASRGAQRSLLAKDIANEHLALLFGVLPLVGEIEGLAALLAQGSLMKLTGRGRRATETTDTDRTPVNSGAGQVLPVALKVQREFKKRLSCRTSISVELLVSEAQSLRDWGFNPVATFYDLVPLSFLLDFVSNVGTFLRAHDPLCGVRFLTGNSTFWDEVSERVEVLGYTHNDNTDIMTDEVTSVASSTGFQRWLRVNRMALTGYPDSQVLWANNFSLAKAATAVALLLQRYIKPARTLLGIKAFRYKGVRPKYLPPIPYKP